MSLMTLSNNYNFSLLRSDLMVKKLRYYARFIVVTLLLNKMDFVKELAKVSIPCVLLF